MKKLFLLALMLFNGNANAALECYNDRGQYFSWTMGEMVPYLDAEPGVYVDCSANGNELLFIQGNFTGIRYAKIYYCGMDGGRRYVHLQESLD
jgi:hypothetical protein